MARAFLYDIQVTDGFVQAFSLDALRDDDLPRVTPNPAGGYTAATIVVDQYGRIVSASNPSTISAEHLILTDIESGELLRLNHTESGLGFGANFITCHHSTAGDVFYVSGNGTVVVSLGDIIVDAGSVSLTAGTIALSAHGPGLLYQATAGADVTVVTSIAGEYTITGTSTDGSLVLVRGNNSLGYIARIFPNNLSQVIAIGWEYILHDGGNDFSVGKGTATTTGRTLTTGFQFQNAGTATLFAGSQNRFMVYSTGEISFGTKTGSQPPNLGQFTFYAGSVFLGDASTTTDRVQVSVVPSWVDSTDASRKARLILSVYDTAAREALRFDADGSNAISSFGGTVTTDTRLTVIGTALGSKVLRLTTAATNDDPNLDVRQNRVATTDATVTTLDTIAITASNTYLIETRVVARRTGGAAGTADDGAVYIRRAMVTTKAGTVTINAVQDELTQEDQAGWDCTFDVSTTNIRIRVTGAVDNNVTWHSTTYVQNLGT